MEDNQISNMEKLNIAQIIILILLSIERILKICINSKCLKKITCKFLGCNFVDIQTEESKSPPESPKNSKESKE